MLNVAAIIAAQHHFFSVFPLLLLLILFLIYGKTFLLQKIVSEAKSAVATVAANSMIFVLVRQ